MTRYALFLDGVQISRAHTTRAEAVTEAYERGAVEWHAEDFPGDTPTHLALMRGYEIRPVTDAPDLS
jgi:hypothetical protein